MNKRSGTYHKFNKLYVVSARAVVISEASLAKASGMKSQPGFVVLVLDDINQTSIVHYGSSRWQ